VNKQELSVQLITKDDTYIETIIKIDYDAFNETFLTNCSLVPYIRYGYVLGLFFCNSLKGFIIFMKTWDNPKNAYLVEIAIKKECQEKGYGCYLLSESLLQLQKEGLSNIYLTVDPCKLKARHIYCDKFGFEFVEYRKNEYGQGRDRLFLRLDLENWISNLSSFPR
jgi:ribosomal-protein-alanine N-acetyltransferase